jgi:hypothetical protein
VQISQWTVVALIIMVFVNTLLIVGIAVLLYLINRKADEALSKAAPLVERATETLARVDETTSQLQVRVDRVLDKTTQLVDHVTERVDTTTAIAEEAVAEPLIGAASLMAGISRGLRAYTERAQEKGEVADGR